MHPRRPKPLPIIVRSLQTLLYPYLLKFKLYINSNTIVAGSYEVPI